MPRTTRIWLYCLAFAGLLSAADVSAQESWAGETFLPMSSWYGDAAERLEILQGQFDDAVHLGQKPISRETLHRLVGPSDQEHRHYRRLLEHSPELSPHDVPESRKAILKYFYRTPADFYTVNKDGFELRINPIINVQAGQELDEGLVVHNSKGIDVRGFLGRRLNFHTYLTDNQTIYPKYLWDKFMRDGAIPYEGRYVTYLSSTLGDRSVVDYFSGGGYVSVQAMRQMNISFGHGRQFLGDGIRSLQLSDYANARLYLQLRTRVWKFQYQNLFTELIEQFDRGNDQLLKRKYMATHHLSIHARKWLNIGLFESVVFSREDGFDFAYLNPLILYRFIEHQLGSPDNVLVGLNAKALIAGHLSLYGQVVLDEFSFKKLRDEPGWWANKFGLQMGLRGEDVLLDGLHFQLEWNRLRPYTYTHNDIKINYTHYNQPLAHPLGANLQEYLLNVNYDLTRNLRIELRSALMWQGLDIDTLNFGSDIFLSNTSRVADDGNEILQGTESLTRYADVNLSYQFKHNCFVDLNATWRSQENMGNTNETLIIGAGIRVNAIRRRIVL